MTNSTDTDTLRSLRPSVLFAYFLCIILLVHVVEVENYRFSTFNQLYVIPVVAMKTHLQADGSLENPFASLQQALDHIVYYRSQQQQRKLELNRITIKLYPTQYFVDTIRLSDVHSHLRLTTMNEEEISIARNFHHLQIDTDSDLKQASLSGGIVVTNWTKVSGNIFSAVVSVPTYINQLFVNNRRLVRTRVPMNPADYLQYAAPLSDPESARYGFQYVPGQFNYPSLTDAMVIVYHSWTTSHHYVDHVIPENNTIIFSNPSNSPIGTYVIQGQRRFHIENLCEALMPNTFCFVNASKTIYLMTDGSYDPTAQTQIIAPVKEFVLVIAGYDVDNPVHDMIIDNIAIQHSAWNIGIHDEADSQAAAFLTSAPVFIANATTITIVGVEISHTGSYGVWIKEGTSDIVLSDSLITDTGAGGIRIGQMISPVPFPTRTIKILSNEVSYGGNVFPSGVAVISHRATDVAIVDNSIHHHRYSGISIGWQWGYADSWTSDILVKGNYIYDVGQHILNDQGGIYMLGLQPGTVITGNVIKNVYSYAIYTWGIYLDEGSSGIVVSNNLVYNTGWASLFQHYGANNTIINNVFARATLNSVVPVGNYPPDGDIHIQLPENHTSWTFTRNIVFDTYQGSNHTAYISSPKVNAPFSYNIYYNPYGTRLLFGSQQVPFDQWQASGQDVGSILGDPLFTGDVNECDLFTIQLNSPAASLGFQNLTKPSKWTPGCSTEEIDRRVQHYYW